MSPFQPKELLATAQQLEQAGERKKAASAYARLSGHLLTQGKFKHALKLVERALTLSPSSFRLYLQMAKCHAGLSGASQAGSALRQFVGGVLKSKHFADYDQFARNALADNSQLLLTYLEALHEAGLDTGENLAAAGNLCLKLNRANDAIRFFMDAIDRYDKPESLIGPLKTALSLARQDGALELLDQFEAREISKRTFLRAMLAQKPQKPKIPHRDQPESLDELIAVIEDELDLEDDHAQLSTQILEFQQRVTGLLRNDDQAWFDLLLSYAQIGVHSLVEEALQHIPEKSPHFAAAQLVRAEVLIEMGELETAAKTLHQVLADKMASEAAKTEAGYQLAWLSFSNKDFGGALQWQHWVSGRDADYRNIRDLGQQLSDRAKSGKRR